MAKAIVVVTRVAVGGEAGLDDLDPENKGRAKLAQPEGQTYPAEEYVADRERLLSLIVAPAIAKAEVPIEWVWLTCPERMDQVREIRDRVYPQAVVADQKEVMRDDVAPDANEIVTVRLDSDDAIHPGALADISMLDYKPGTLINWPDGYQLNINTGEFAEKGWPLRTQGPFLAMVRKDRSRMLDFGGPHTYARERDDVREVVHQEGRAWIQTIHGWNQLSSWQKGREPFDLDDTKEVLSLFGIWEVLAHV